ncbi:MAG TPA: sel1 repeat family protein, partial [Leucothrix mucor]|nr:sel1 repeat family protein [Leucothrix mucor]
MKKLVKFIISIWICLFFIDLKADAVQENITSCGAGNSDGCVELANLYYEGNGVKHSYSKAQAYYRKACDAGNGRGCVNLG